MTVTPRHQQPHRARAAARPSVCVVAPSWQRRQATCTCGWHGRRRLLRAVAVLDALTHAYGGCEPAVPLIYRQPVALRPGGSRS